MQLNKLFINSQNNKIKKKLIFYLLYDVRKKNHLKIEVESLISNEALNGSKIKKKASNDFYY